MCVLRGNIHDQNGILYVILTKNILTRKFFVVTHRKKIYCDKFFDSERRHHTLHEHALTRSALHECSAFYVCLWEYANMVCIPA